MKHADKQSIVRAFCSSHTIQLVQNHFNSSKINFPINLLEFDCRLHKSKKSSTINLEMRIDSPIGFYWEVIAIYERIGDSLEIRGTLMYKYAEVYLEETNLMSSHLRHFDCCKVLKRNAVIALHSPLLYAHLAKNKCDAELVLNGVNIKVLLAFEPNTFNVWLGDRYGISMAIGVVRLDLNRIDSITGVTDIEFEWCDRHELLTLFKNVGVNPYENDTELLNNRFDLF
jgi:hypothetical protein